MGHKIRCVDALVMFSNSPFQHQLGQFEPFPTIVLSIIGMETLNKLVELLKKTFIVKSNLLGTIELQKDVIGGSRLTQNWYSFCWLKNQTAQSAGFARQIDPLQRREQNIPITFLGEIFWQQFYRAEPD